MAARDCWRRQTDHQKSVKAKWRGQTDTEAAADTQLNHISGACPVAAVAAAADGRR